MKKTFLAIACGLVMALTVATAQAAPLSTSDTTYVGSVDPGTPAEDTFESSAINYLLGMTPSDTDTNVALPPNPPTYTYTLARSANQCTSLGGCTAITEPNSGKINYQDPTDPVTVDTGDSLYLLAKMGNKSYVWYVGNVDSVEVPDTLGAKGTGLSHVTLFGGTTSVPDGGTTLGLLGLGMMGLGYLRRRMA
jgi:hypothetical protein